MSCALYVRRRKQQEGEEKRKEKKRKKKKIMGEICKHGNFQKNKIKDNLESWLKLFLYKKCYMSNYK
jgi:hypothetical protein